MIALVAAASAASLDNVEVGGVWGTPLAENPTAIWWNPAGLSQTHGTQVLIEGAPTFGHVTFVREDPYNAGTDTFRLQGVLPFAGVSSDFGVKGLGVGAALIVPFVRGGQAESASAGPASFAMNEADVRTIHGALAVGYQPDGVPIALGLSGQFVHSEWTANLDTELTTSLDSQIAALGQDSGYTDAQIESQDYAANLDFDTLSDNTFTFSAGLHADVEPFKIALAYVHGVNVQNAGDLTMNLNCPPTTDTLGRFGAEAYGLCYATMNAHAVVAYKLPARLQGALGFAPNDDTALQFMGAYVFWSAYKDFDITVKDIENLNELENPDAAALLNQHRFWARDNVDTYWVGLDGKFRVKEVVILGARAIYDHHGVPNVALSPNNVDTDVFSLTPSVTVDIKNKVRIGASYGHSFFTARDIDDNGFGVTLDQDARNEDRYFYPQMNGQYSGSIDRVGVVVSGRFGVKEEDEGKAPF